MTDHSESSAGTPSARGHEPTTLSGRSAATWGAALGGLIVVALLLTWGLWQWLRASGPAGVAPIAATTEVREDISSGQAPLNPNQHATRREYLHRQHTLLSEYAWVDRKPETARIPIDRAMEIIVERASDK